MCVTVSLDGEEMGVNMLTVPVILTVMTGEHVTKLMTHLFVWTVQLVGWDQPVAIPVHMENKNLPIVDFVTVNLVMLALDATVNVMKMVNVMPLEMPVIVMLGGEDPNVKCLVVLVMKKIVPYMDLVTRLTIYVLVFLVRS